MIKRRNALNRFELPNKLWQMNLEATELMILAVIYYAGGWREDTRFMVKRIAATIHRDKRTVKKYAAAMVQRGILNEDLTLTRISEPKIGRDFFSLPRQVFMLDLSPSEFAVYAYLNYREDRRTYQCSPSLRTIAAATRLSKGTVVKAIDQLYEKELITVKESYRCDERGRWKDNNLYTILPVYKAVEMVYQRTLTKAERAARQARAAKKFEALKQNSTHLQATVAATENSAG